MPCCARQPDFLFVLLSTTLTVTALPYSTRAPCRRSELLSLASCWELCAFLSHPPLLPGASYRRSGTRGTSDAVLTGYVVSYCAKALLDDDVSQTTEGTPPSALLHCAAA